MITFSINLPILIILWWVGAIIAGISLLIPQYNYYLIGGSLGWITVVITSGLIIYAIKRNNKESQKNKPSKIS
jgi:flagellar biosynthesis protein FliR